MRRPIEARFHLSFEGFLIDTRHRTPIFIPYISPLSSYDGVSVGWPTQHTSRDVANRTTLHRSSSTNRGTGTSSAGPHRIWGLGRNTVAWERIGQ